MAGEGNKYKVDDFTSHDDADDQLGDGKDDLGNELDEEQQDDEGQDDKGQKKPPAKKSAPAKKDKDDDKDDEEEEGEEEDDEDEEEEDDSKPKKSEAELKLEKKLARTGRAREALEQQVKDLRNQLQQQQEQRSDAAKAKFDKLVEELDGLYEQVEEHRAKGETKDAAKAQRRIDEIRDNMTRSQAAMLATKEAMQQAETRAYNTMVRELESLDPRFDPDDDDFDQELLDSVSELVDGYEAKGMALTDALRKACKLLLREDVFAKGRSLKREKPVDKSGDKSGEKPAARKTDVKKNLDTAKKLPPDAPNKNREKAEGEIDMETISEKDFDALPESTLRRMLGDED